MVEARDIHWLAGLLEGEGCFRFHGSSPQISCLMTDRDVIERAQTMLGGSILTRTRPPNKTSHTVCIHGRQAAGWMMTLYSMLGQRRQAKIRETLRLWKAGPRRPNGPEVTCHPGRLHRGKGLCGACYQRFNKCRRREAALARSGTTQHP